MTYVVSLAKQPVNGPPLILKFSYLILLTISGNLLPPMVAHNIDLHNAGPETLDIIRARGFISEQYRVISRDGSPMSAYCIVNPLADQNRLYRLPILIFHGLAGDASQMLSRSRTSRPRRPVIGQIVQGPGDECLGFMLANNNFDVWLADPRGSNLNDHSVGVDYDFEMGNKFWNFTLDEQALLDTPTLVDHVLEQTQAERLHYVGYSESTFFMFALPSARPDYQQKLASFTALAPVAYVTHLSGLGLPSFLPLLLTPDNVNWNYMPQPLMDSVGSTVRTICTNKLLSALICYPVAKTATGSGQATAAASFFSSIFKGTSVRAIKQFIQLFLSKRFGMYDYGPAGNLLQYGRPRPPDYDLANIRLPTIILIRGRDLLLTSEDQALLKQKINATLYLDIWLPHCSHMDFLLAKNLASEVHLPIARAMPTIVSSIDHGDERHISRDPQRPVVRTHPPTKMATTEVAPKLESHLVSNMLEGLIQNGSRASARVGLTVDEHAPLGMIRNFGQQLDRLGLSINNLNQVLLLSST